MDEDKRWTGFSVAESVDPLTSGKLFDASQKLREQYAKAAAGRQNENQQAVPGGPAPAPGGMDYKMKTGIGRAVDAQEHNNQLADYANRVKQLNNSAKARKDPQNSLESKNERGQDNDGRGR